MKTQEIINYLKHLCEDFKGQGEHFELTKQDAEIIEMAIQKLKEEPLCTNGNH